MCPHVSHVCAITVYMCVTLHCTTAFACVSVSACMHIIRIKCHTWTDLPTKISIKLFQRLQTLGEVVTVHFGIKR